MSSLAVLVMATQLASSFVPVAHVKRCVRQHGQALFVMTALIALLQSQATNAGIDVSAGRWLAVRQAVDLLASVFSLYMGSRWLRNTAPSLRSAARAAKLQQGLALARLAAWSAAGPAPQLRLVLFSLEAAMILVTSWRLWSSASLVGTFGSAAQLFVTSCLLEFATHAVHIAVVFGVAGPAATALPHLARANAVVYQGLMPLGAHNFVTQFFMEYFCNAADGARDGLLRQPSASKSVSHEIGLDEYRGGSHGARGARHSESSERTAERKSEQLTRTESRSAALPSMPQASLPRPSRDLRRTSAAACALCGYKHKGGPLDQQAAAMMRLLRSLREHFGTAGRRFAHDLKNPLNAIFVLNEMQLNQAAPGGGNNANEVEATMGCVVQLLAMTNMMRDNLLAFAAAPGDWPLARVDVSATVEQALKEAQPLLRSSKVKLQADVAEGLHGLADKARLHQALVTLLYVAARHAMRKPLHVSLRSDGSMIEFRTRDEGRGFGDDVMERFSKPANDMDAAHPDSSLSVGLTAVKRICEHLCWQMQVSNASPGSQRKGGTVTLRIPCG